MNETVGPAGFVQRLPEGVEQAPDGSFFRRVQYPVDQDPRTGEILYEERIRSVALTQAEAVEKRLDFFHPQMGWIRDGIKKETDLTPQQVLADGSQSFARIPQ